MVKARATDSASVKLSPATSRSMSAGGTSMRATLSWWRTRSWEVDADHLSSAMALTTVSYNEETGQILAVDGGRSILVVGGDCLPDRQWQLGLLGGRQPLLDVALDDQGRHRG